MAVVDVLHSANSGLEANLQPTHATAGLEIPNLDDGLVRDVNRAFRETNDSGARVLDKVNEAVDEVL